MGVSALRLGSSWPGFSFNISTPARQSLLSSSLWGRGNRKSNAGHDELECFDA
jgi:hypothetical protein